jgi:cytidylate kinase
MPLEPAFALVNGRTFRTEVGVDGALTLFMNKTVEAYTRRRSKERGVRKFNSILAGELKRQCQAEGNIVEVSEMRLS